MEEIDLSIFKTYGLIIIILGITYVLSLWLVSCLSNSTPNKLVTGFHYRYLKLHFKIVFVLFLVSIAAFVFIAIHMRRFSDAILILGKDFIVKNEDIPDEHFYYGFENLKKDFEDIKIITQIQQKYVLFMENLMIVKAKEFIMDLARYKNKTTSDFLNKRKHFYNDNNNVSLLTMIEKRPMHKMDDKLLQNFGFAISNEEYNCSNRITQFIMNYWPSEKIDRIDLKLFFDDLFVELTDCEGGKYEFKNKNRKSKKSYVFSEKRNLQENLEFDKKEQKEIEDNESLKQLKMNGRNKKEHSKKNLNLSFEQNPINNTPNLTFKDRFDSLDAKNLMPMGWSIISEYISKYIVSLNDLSETDLELCTRITSLIDYRKQRLYKSIELISHKVYLLFGLVGIIIAIIIISAFFVLRDFGKFTAKDARPINKQFSKRMIIYSFSNFFGLFLVFFLMIATASVNNACFASRALFQKYPISPADSIFPNKFDAAQNENIQLSEQQLNDHRMGSKIIPDLNKEFIHDFHEILKLESESDQIMFKNRLLEYFWFIDGLTSTKQEMIDNIYKDLVRSNGDALYQIHEKNISNAAAGLNDGFGKFLLIVSALCFGYHAIVSLVYFYNN